MTAVTCWSKSAGIGRRSETVHVLDRSAAMLTVK
jgi:hypothetical protein